jgi:glycosyltransferase involved in cell wall biosynthesis
MWPSRARPDRGIFVADQAEAIRRAGVDLDVHHFEPGGAAAYLRGAARLAGRRGGQYDVIHSHFGLSAWVALAARGQVRAVTFHGTDLNHPRSRRISLAALRFTDLPAAASADLAALIPPGQAKTPVQVLPCGISLGRFTPLDREQARSNLGIDPGERVILLPSDPTRPEKRADRAIELAEATGARLLTLGGIEPDRVPLFINAADVVAIPSEREGFGLALLEALACKRPVLSTPTGIAGEALDRVEGALCAEWDLPTWTAAAESAFAAGTLDSGREIASRWSADSCARKVIEAWETALSRA